MRLRDDKFLGPDDLYSGLLKEVNAEIVEVLVMIFQNSLPSGKGHIELNTFRKNMMC